MIFFPFILFAQEEKEVVEHESGFYYTVQEGDTLWDLSQRFSDSPWLWPDLWQGNKQIPNPHWIYPGERIRLFHREGIQSFTTKTKEAEKETAAEDETPKEQPYYYYSSINRVGFIKKQPVAPSGVIFKVKDNVRMIAEGDLVYIKQEGGTPLKSGDKYTVYRTFDPLKDQKTKALIGTYHYLTGVVEITKTEPSFAVAKVVESYRAIAIDDLLMPYEKRSPKIYLTESKQGLNGKVIISETYWNINGDHNILYVDKGNIDGVKRGQLYHVYYQEKEQIKNKTIDKVLLPPVVYGTLLVLFSEETTSSVIVTQADKSIGPDALVGSPN